MFGTAFVEFPLVNSGATKGMPAGTFPSRAGSKHSASDAVKGADMRTLVRDFLHGTRMTARRPGLTVTAVLALGLGIGANTAVFSVVNTVLLRPLPYAGQDRLVALGWSYFNFHRWREQRRSMEAVSAVNPFSMSLSTGDEPTACRA
jgi:hypothetical protein